MTVIITVLMILLSAAPAAADPRYDLQVELKKQVLSFPDQKPYIDTFGGRSYLPLQIVADALGIDVKWDASTYTAIVKHNDREVHMEVGAKTVMVKGQEQELNGRAELADNRLMVPADFFSKGLGFDMYWDYGTRLVIIF
ncbi:MAG: copper amine oxidase N-terminal domain-containing protein [Syntrophomonas sp.]